MYDIFTTSAIPRDYTSAKDIVGEYGEYQSHYSGWNPEHPGILQQDDTKKRAADKMLYTAADIGGKSSGGNAMALGSWGQTEWSILNLLY